MTFVKLACSVQEEESTLPCRRGFDLHCLKLWPSQPGIKLRGLLVYHHGFGEHCNRHAHILRQLVERLQLLVVTFDVHGHGRSGPHSPALRAYVHSHKHLVQDLLDVIDKVALPAAMSFGIPADKVFLSGHSMGGMAAILATLERPHMVSGLILTSPFISVTQKESWGVGELAKITVLRLLALFIPTKPMWKRRSVEDGIRDPEAVKAVLADTLWYRDPIKVRTVVSCIDGTLAVQHRARQLTLPMYIQQGTRDLTCSVDSLRRLLPRLGSKDITYNEVEGAYHDLWLDPDTPKCVDKVTSWLEARL